MSDLDTLMRFARAYASLGSAVQSQLDALLDGETDGLNPNAVDLMRDRLRGMDDELDGIIDDALIEGRG